MQTLGLSGESQRSDGWLKSIFWPTVENAWDVNYLGQQGFWICLIIALFQMTVGSISGNPILAIFSIVEALVFVVGGMGVREGNWLAAAMVFSIFFLNLLYGLLAGQFPGALMIIGAGILLSNVRAAFLASEWRPPGENEDRPTRFNETLRDKLVDQIPARAWLVLQIPFFGVASVLLLMSLAGLAVTLLHRFGVNFVS